MIYKVTGAEYVVYKAKGGTEKRALKGDLIKDKAKAVSFKWLVDAGILELVKDKDAAE